MKTFLKILPSLRLLSLLAVLVACKDNTKPDDPLPQPAPVPTVTGFDPTSALPGGTITITGTNFDPTAANNTVTIGGVAATVVSATATSLVVTVPNGAQAGAVVVSVGGKTGQSATSFALAPKALKRVVEVQGTTFANQTWTSDKVYLLRGLVYIPADYTLYIEPGTVIKGAGPEQDPLGKGAAGTLIVERRGKIMAPGTAANPIVFTSAKAPGQRKAGDWGGIVLSGKAPTNRPGTTALTGGLRGTTELYNEPEDNSGVLQYVRIEYAGSPQPGSPDVKLGGLTLHGVGRGTVIDHVQVSYGSGDAFAWFGGTVNAKNLVAYRAFDDDWSTDWGYGGLVQFGLALRDPALADPAGANGVESQNFDPGENPGGALTTQNGAPLTAPVFANLSNFVFNAPPAAGAYRSALLLRRNTALSVYNSLFYGYPEGLHLEGTATGTAANLQNGTLDLRGLVLANVPTPVVGEGAISTDQATAYFSAADRKNQIIASADLPALLLNAATFNLTAPYVLPQAGSPLLSGAVTGGKLGATFFTPVLYRGAFGSENWLAGWTSFNPQEVEYDR